MELGEGDARMCRLCGQYESMYIDVFSDEGTKRLLGLKIHSKINILITENDGLPHVVCLRCIGTLEFLCDFYNCCQLTQRKLTLQQAITKYSSQSTPRRTPQAENDAEFNKENVLPSASGAKRRCKVASPGKKDQPTNENALDLRNQPATTTAGVQEQKLQGGQSTESPSALGNPLSIKDTSKEGSKFFSSCIVPMKQGEANDKIALAKPKRLAMGLKRKLKTLGGVCKSSNSVKRSQEGSNETTHDENQPKRQCLSVICRNSTSNVSDETGRDANPRKRQSLGAICTNGTSNVAKNAATLSKPQVELPLENKVATIAAIPSNKDCIKTNDVNKDSNAERKEEDTKEASPILIIVKQENTDVKVISQETEKPNQLVWIPTEVLTEGQTVCQDQEIELDLSLRLSPDPLDDDTETSGVVTARADANDRTKEQTRATVIRSLRKSPAPVVVKPDVSSNTVGTKNDSKAHRDSSWGMLSKMLSSEQRKEIETYYRIDMSVVKAEEVQKNLTVVSKKDIRCNICGTVYFRMDKCQVHIWGHLQMKPYKCKACNFVTVTVSNMRTHIRKSHLKIKPYECNVCGKNFTTHSLMMEHINGHTGDRPFKCNICDYSCSSRQVLTYHNNVNHKPIKEINCKTCGLEFYSRSKLRTHMLVHKKDKMIMCKICSSYLSNERALEAHHKNLHTREYTCDVCGKLMKSRKALSNHLNVHSTGKHKCTLCPNVYKSSQILKEHLLKHEGIRKYTCGECGKAFGQLSHLAAHKAVHSGIRYYCPGCEKPFNRHDNMKIHTKRCKPFLANPELKKLLLKKESSPATSKVNMSTADTTSKDAESLNSQSFEKQTDNEEISIKTVDDKKETAMKLGLNISCIESPDKSWIRDNAYEEVAELTVSGELSAIQIVEPNDTFTLENDNVRVLEIL